MAFMTKDEYEAYVAEHAANVISAEDIAHIKTALQPLIGAQFNILSIPKEILLAFEPSQIGTIIGSLMDACIPQLSKITESNTFDSVGLRKNDGILGEREGYPDYLHTSGKRLELKLLFVDNPNIEMKKPPTPREPQEVQAGKTNTKMVIAKKLVDKHGLSKEDALWLLDALCFEKVNLDDLDLCIQTQISGYVPVMSAPTLAKDLLIQHISTLSKSKGYTTLKMWKEKIHEIGANIAAIDGFYKEYNKSLVRLSELRLNNNQKQLKQEYSQGVSAHPTHIRNNLDFKRSYWMEEIQAVINSKGVAILKGVSGQGKSTLCYRYLIDTYSEGCVFCVRSIANEGQAQNLVTALDGLGKHNQGLIIYIDVQPGETLWAFLLQELQSRGLAIPVLISIRDEDYNLTPISGKAIQYGIVELALSKEEAEHIYNSFTEIQPHAKHRTFEEAWQSFGGQGPLIYWKTHGNQSA